MVTYLYWIAVSGLIVLIVAWAAYYFHYEQLFVKNYGGVMTLSVPQGQIHLSATWKEDHLWIENYDPKTNKCHFSEYSRGHLLEGQVVIENCNPAIPDKN